MDEEHERLLLRRARRDRFPDEHWLLFVALVIVVVSLMAIGVTL